MESDIGPSALRGKRLFATSFATVTLFDLRPRLDSIADNERDRDAILARPNREPPRKGGYLSVACVCESGHPPIASNSDSFHAFPKLTLHRMSSDAMITVHLPAPLRDCCEGASELAFPAPSLRAVLDALEQRHPSLHRSICDETGTVRRHVNLFVNINHMRDCNGLDTPLVPGDVVTILPAVSGG